MRGRFGSVPHYIVDYFSMKHASESHLGRNLVQGALTRRKVLSDVTRQVLRQGVIHGDGPEIAGIYLMYLISLCKEEY